MRAIVITRPGDLASLQVREVDRPDPGPGEVRVRVLACGLNRADLLQAQGKYPAPPGVSADIPGLEFVGEVEAVGPGDGGPHRVGDRVMGIVGGGAFAEFLVCHQRVAVAVPANLDEEGAASIPEAFITAHDALEGRGGSSRATGS